MTPFILNTYIDNISYLSCPSKQTEDIKNAILEKVRRNRYSREKTCAYIAVEVKGVSTKTVWRILRASRLRKTKPTQKPKLTEQIKLKRLKFYRDYTY